MTYEEIRVYATHVHKIPDPPHKAADSGYCCGDSNAKVRYFLEPFLRASAVAMTVLFRDISGGARVVQRRR